MSRIGLAGRKYWFDVLIAALAIEAWAELIVGRDNPDSARSLWFALPAVVVLVLPLFARRRFPFAALTAYWVLAAAIAFIDWRPIPYAHSLVAIGLSVAFLLGNL